MSHSSFRSSRPFYGRLCYREQPVRVPFVAVPSTEPVFKNPDAARLSKAEIDRLVRLGDSPYAALAPGSVGYTWVNSTRLVLCFVREEEGRLKWHRMLIPAVP